MFTDEEALALYPFYLRPTTMRKEEDINILTIRIRLAITISITTRRLQRKNKEVEVLTVLLPKVTPESIEWYQQNYPEYII